MRFRALSQTVLLGLGVGGVILVLPIDPGPIELLGVSTMAAVTVGLLSRALNYVLDELAPVDDESRHVRETLEAEYHARTRGPRPDGVDWL
jgi:hypothetical protein